MNFCMDSDEKAQMPIPVTAQEPSVALTREKMLADADQMLGDFLLDYKRMAE